MNTNFSSIEMIMDQFGIEEGSMDELRSKLRIMQTEHHPDKNGGSFVDEDRKRKYHELDKAISYIDSIKKNTDLVTVSAVTDLTKAVTAMVAAQNEASSKDTLLSFEINRSIESYHSKLKTPKIALTAITVAISVIWMFPNTVKEHPVLSQFINFDSISTNIAWFYMLFFAVVFWVITWRREDLTKQQQESLKTESVQNRLFTSFINSLNNDTFTIESFVDFIIHSHKRHRRYPFFFIFGSSSRIDSSLAHATAEVILERALKRKAITSHNSGSISTAYQVTSSKSYS
ncbi:J domain-containing protein [Photobacterium phosphoreum]|uniref:J domain-containing protein n=1 Tax=Photobacterium phosphoreum TaxID=659 RepID=UPI000D170FB8|nr:J domain-containing protein [Photobacterium phosphoreum]MCD9474359.1 J domain-containing protein [Photobacterium phosphoreum]MCF2174894.1 J domain-containing protein [Photobacterium phosphoreum]PSU55327.1 J domain-containing protein [Photobacterium phosphoreum]